MNPTNIPLHDMDYCEREANGDPITFAALLGVSYPYMTSDRRAECVADFTENLLHERRRQARARRAAVVSKIMRVVTVVWTLVIVAYVVTHIFF